MDKQKETERKWAYLELPKAYVNERETEKKRKFYSCSIPSGTQIEGKDIGNWRFNAPIVSDPVVNWETMERDPDAKYYSICVLNKPMQLNKSEKNEEGEWAVTDTMEVDPKRLRSALQEGYRNYKKQKEVEQASEKTHEEKKENGPRQQPKAPAR